MRRINKIAIGLCLFLLLIVSVPSSLAYFFTYARTNGSASVKLEHKTDIEEDKNVVDVKKLTIKAATDSDPVMIRAKAFCGSDVEVVMQDEWTSGKESYKSDWTIKPDADGWYYYSKPIDGKTSSAYIDDSTYLELHVNINVEDPKELDTRHVVVVYEAAPAVYDDATGKWTANWEAVIETN